MIEADPRTRDSIWQGVSLALAALADPRVLDAVSPTEDETFDPEVFIRNKGTLYLLASGAGAGDSAALVAALVEDLVETCRRIAARSPGARLDPPVLLALDEIGNLAPLPSLPTLMAEGGGTGITTMPVLQSLAQARDKWSDDQASAIWDASIVKIVLGGASNSRDLQDLSTLIGERDEFTDSVSFGVLRLTHEPALCASCADSAARPYSYDPVWHRCRAVAFSPAHHYRSASVTQAPGQRESPATRTQRNRNAAAAEACF